MTVITTIEDLRVLAQKRVPRMFYDYADSGSWTESTYRANESDFQKIKLRQRVAVNIEGRSTATKMVGVDVSMPVAIAPTGLTGMQHADGEILAAKAAEAFGIPFTLSTMSICSIEDIAGHTKAPFWFQLYVMRDRDFIERLIDRAKAAKCGALMVTLDLQILGQRHKDLKNGLSAPPRLTIANILNMMSKPRWCVGMAGTKRRQFGNIVGHVKGVTDMANLAAWTAQQFDPRLNWGDVEWIKKRWGGKLILKGIQDIEDARLAVQSGADALIVSNHGGRQLDGAQSSIEALPAIVADVGSKIEVHMDGGIRSGQDVLKAWALGARGTYIGRAMLYGLGAMGQQGVAKAISIIHNELDLTMAFCGHTKIGTVDRSILLPGTFPSHREMTPAAGGRVNLPSSRTRQRESSMTEEILAPVFRVRVGGSREAMRLLLASNLLEPQGVIEEDGGIIQMDVFVGAKLLEQMRQTPGLKVVGEFDANARGGDRKREFEPDDIFREGRIPPGAGRLTRE